MNVREDGKVSVFVKKHASGRLEMWSWCEPLHAQALHDALSQSMTTRSYLMEEKFFDVALRAGVPHEAAQAFLEDLREDDAVILRPPHV